MILSEPEEWHSDGPTCRAPHHRGRTIDLVATQHRAVSDTAWYGDEDTFGIVFSDSFPASVRNVGLTPFHCSDLDGRLVRKPHVVTVYERDHGSAGSIKPNVSRVRWTGVRSLRNEADPRITSLIVSYDGRAGIR